MSTSIKNDELFLQRAIRFCDRVDYYSLLELDEIKVYAFKSNKPLIDYFLKNMKHLNETNENPQNDVTTWEVGFIDLTQACKDSRNYTKQIGVDLGIETDLRDVKMRVFTACNGNGIIPCPGCGGTGFDSETIIDSASPQNTEILSGPNKCTKCGGTGELICSHCNGTGWVPDK